MSIRETWRRIGWRGISIIQKRSNAKSARADDEAREEGGGAEKGAAQDRGGENARAVEKAQRAQCAASHHGRSRRSASGRSHPNLVAGFSADRATARDGPEPPVPHGGNFALRRT